MALDLLADFGHMSLAVLVAFLLFRHWNAGHIVGEGRLETPEKIEYDYDVRARSLGRAIATVREATGISSSVPMTGRPMDRKHHWRIEYTVHVIKVG